MPRYKKRRPSSTEEESDNDFEESTGMDDHNELRVASSTVQAVLRTSSGRIVRPVGNVKMEKQNSFDEPSNETFNSMDMADIKPQMQSTLRRIRNNDTDKTYAPDLTKIQRYLMAVRNTRNNAFYQLAKEENEREQSGKPTICQLWSSPRITERTDGFVDEFIGWKIVKNISPSLSKWHGTNSIGFVVHSTVPKNFSQVMDDGKKVERRPLPIKSPTKRGRPRKDEEKHKKRLLAAISNANECENKTPAVKGRAKKVPAPLIDTKPITVNERLHSLVDTRIQHASTGSRPSSGRRTNNSMASTLYQQQMLPSTSSTTFRWADRHPTIATKASNPLALGENGDEQITFPRLTNVKIEVEDFNLPPDFASPNFAISTPLHSTDRESTGEQFIHQHQTQQDKDTMDKSTDSPKTTEHLPNTDKKDKQKSHGGIELPVPTSEEELIRIPIFGARTFAFDVDQSAAVQRFESVQVVDLFHTLPFPTSPDPAIVRKQSADGMANGCTSSSELNISTIDRMVLRQGKRVSQQAQALFCGGPISAIAICPRTLSNGCELFAIATIADEKFMNLPTDENTYLQMWTINPADLMEPAEMDFLLRIPDTPQICSLMWCPLLDNVFLAFKKTSSTGTSNEKEQSSVPLGLLAVATTNGRIHIFRIPEHLDEFIAQNRQQSKPLICEICPLLTLRHPTISLKSKKKGGGGPNDEENAGNQMDSIPLYSLQWSPFNGARHIAAVSASGSVHIWDILHPSALELPKWSLDFTDWLAPPTCVGWMDHDKICVTSRYRQLRVYKLLVSDSPLQQEFTSSLVFECDNSKSVGIACCTRPLLFPGVVSFDALSFNYMGYSLQAPCYIWTVQQNNQNGSKFEEIEQICATSLSNCHQIRLSSTCICPLSGICSSVGADGRLVCSLNGRMTPKEGLKCEMESFLHGRTLLQLLRHSKQKLLATTEKEMPTGNEAKDRNDLCYTHQECCDGNVLEIRLGDCALLDQKNERASGRRTGEVCLDRRMEALNVVETSNTNVGLTFCGGESGIVFVVPCTL